MITVDTQVVWNDALVVELVEITPIAAHAEATVATARAVAAKAGRATGRLQSDLQTPKPLGPMLAEIGSDLVYAGIQNRGGTITPKRSPRLLIHAGPGGSGPIVASADAVFIRGTHYLDEAIAYLPLMAAQLAARYPHA